MIWMVWSVDGVEVEGVEGGEMYGVEGSEVDGVLILE